MELRKNWRKLTTALSRFWHREAGPMNWKNPVRVTAYIGWEIFNGAAFLVGEWVRYGVRASHRFAPTQSPRQTGQALTFGVCHAPCFKSVLPVPGRGRRFPSRVRVWPLPTIHK